MKLQRASEDEISNFLTDNPLWTRKDELLERELSAADFPSAVGLINAVAVVSESICHHPDIYLYGWNKLRISLSTKDIGGISSLDFTLAKKIDSIGF